MYISRFYDKITLGQSAAALAATAILDAIEAEGKTSIVLATGTSQLEMLSTLVMAKIIDWSKVELFHLDEYIGLPATHPASFRNYLRERFAEKVGNLAAFHEVRGDAANPVAECRRLANLIQDREISVACVGVGENGHLAFNDPPADFETKEPYIIVELDEKCRRQQFGEGWFPTLEDVPRKAISMSCQQILKAKQVVCTVPDLRKAEAVRDTVYGDVSPEVPASILQKHPDCTLFLDIHSASLLERLA